MRVAGEDICSQTNFRYIFLIYFYYFMGMSILPLCMYICVSLVCDPGAHGGCELPHECREWNPGPLQHLLLTTKPTLQLSCYQFLEIVF